MDYTAEVAIGLRRNPQESLSYALSKLITPLEIPAGLEQIIIKPSIYDPDLVGNTNPDMVKAVIPIFKSLAPVSIVESDNPFRSSSAAFTKCGYDRLIEDDVHLVNLSLEPCLTMVMPGHYFKKHDMPVLLQRGFLLINIPTMKLEPNQVSVGAGIKNLFGLLPEVDKRIYHASLQDILLDLLIAFRPHLTIVDLTKIVLGNRNEGVTRDANAVLVGRDPVAVDAVCADLLNLNPMKIGLLKSAHQLGLGEVLIDRIRIIGTEEQKTKLSKLCQI